MASTEFIPNFIGIPFDAVPDDSRRIIHASLKSNDDLGGDKVDSVVLSGTTPADFDFDSNGASNGGDAYIKWTPTTDQIASLNISAHYHFEIESSFMNHTVTTANRLLTLGGGGHKLYLSTSNALWNQLDGSGVGDTSLKALVEYDVRNNSHTVIDVIVQGSLLLTYFDGLLVRSETRDATANNATINLFASQTGTEEWGATDAGVCVERIKNFYVTTGPVGFWHHKSLSNIHIYGDSLSQKGNLPAGYPDSTGVAGAIDNKDIGMASAIIKKLTSKSIKSNLQNHAVAGDALADVIGDVGNTKHLAGCAVCVNIGINNAKTGVLTANWQTDYESLITSIKALGADHIFIWTLASTAEDSVVPEATSRPSVAEANVIVKAIADADADVTLVDIDSIAGFSSNFDATYYNSADLHWSQDGYRISGEFIGDILLKHYGL